LGEKEAGELAAVFAGLRAMSMDRELQKHYALLLGIGSPWEVKAVGRLGQVPGVRTGMFDS
jgi:hypothetical protein